MNHLDQNQNYTLNQHAKGRVRMWQYTKDSGFGKLLYDAPNLITKEGAYISARAIAGYTNSSITHMYIGYDPVGTGPTTVTPTTDDTISSFTSPLVVPITFTPTLGTVNSYPQPNVAYFTAYITGSMLANGDSINSLGLVNRTNSADYLFSKIGLSMPVVFDTAHSIAITWGVTFTTAMAVI